MKTSQMLKVIPIATLALLMSCSGNKSEEATETQNEKVKVKVETVSVQDVEQLSEFTATVEANIKNNIAPQTPFRIEKIFAEVGDHVKAGQLLAKMDATSLKQAKIQLDNQEIEFKRIDELYKVGGASKSAWDAQKTSLEVARETYKNLVENTQLLSPISGVVTARNYDSGDMYSGGSPIYTVEEIRPVKLMVNVSESLFTKVKKGHEVDIRLDVYGDEVFKGKVNLVYPTIDPSTRTFPVEIKIANSDERVRPGMRKRITDYEFIWNSGKKARIDRPCICGDRDLRTFFLKQVISGLASGDRDEHHHGDDGLSRRQRFGYRDECFEALGKRVE